LAKLTAENLIGARGEAIFVARIMDFCGRDLPYFDPHFLGDKFPVFDHLVNVIDGESISAYFFAQVKTTSKGYVTRADGKRYLNVSVSKASLNDMVIYPGPAYLFGIDEVDGKAFIVGIDKAVASGFSAMPATYELDCTTIRQLWDEVKAYWSSPTVSFSSRFSL